MTTPRIAFIHIPKTGGSQLVGKIINLWPKVEVSPHTGQPGFMRDGPACYKYHFTAGHVFYPMMRSLLHPDTKFFTVLRDPIERAYSHYNHLVKFKQTEATSFEEFVYESDNAPLARNLMAKHIGWWPKDFQGIPEHTAVIEHLPFDVSDDELYGRTIKALEDFLFVGLQSLTWVETIQKVYDEFNRPMPAGVVQGPNKNYRSLMSPKLIGDLEEFNQVDMRIYDKYKKELGL